MKKIILLLSTLFIAATAQAKDIKLLAYSQVEPGQYHHLSNLAGIALLEKLGAERGWDVDVTHNPDSFNDERLSQYNVVAIINSNGNILNDAQQAAFKKYVQNGGGYVGTHSASDSEKEWPWYGEYVGAFFKSHPTENQVGSVKLENKDHPVLKHMPDVVPVLEEWYDFTENIRGKEGFTVLMTLDENTYEGGITGPDHPITWVNESEKGRMFYTGFSHFFAPNHPFLAELLTGGVEWAAGN